MMRAWLWVAFATAVAASLGAGTRSRRICESDDQPLQVREEHANVILTGTVRGVFPDWEHPNMQKAQVEVKRVIKGDNVINSLPGVNPYKPWMRRVVMIDGIGDPHICHSKARRYDTKIFLLNKAKNGELKLNSSLVRLTLSNLEMADAAVKGKLVVGVSERRWRWRGRD